MSSYNGLQCFFAESYATLDEWESDPRRCLAPTTHKTRCKWTISDADMADAARKLNEAKGCLNAQLEINLLREFVILHCCERHHRHKLEADETGCLERIVMAYKKELKKKLSISQAEPAINESTPVTVQLYASPVLEIKTEHQAEDYRPILTQNTNRMQTRSQAVTNIVRIPREPGWKFEVFFPYKSDPKDSIREDLLQAVPNRWVPRGEVYSFIWPLHPQFVKIGYTSKSALGRVEYWQKCHPGAILSKRFTVDYPERIERLVHLQLKENRHRIRICISCFRSHEEWFKASTNEVNQVISDWVELANRDYLYERDRTLTRKWRDIVHKIDGEITAKVLLDRLDAAETKRQSDISCRLIVSQTGISCKLQPVPASSSQNLAVATDGALNRTQPQDLIMMYFEEFMQLITQADTHEEKNLISS